MTSDEADDMCPNCVTPWKCNGPHLSDQTPRALDAARSRPATDPAGLDVERLAEAIFRVGTGYRDRATASIAARIANSQDGARASGEFAEAIAAEYARLSGPEEAQHD